MKRVYVFISLLLISGIIEANSKGLVEPNKRLGMFNLQLRQIFQSNRLEGVSPQYRSERISSMSQYKEGDYTFSKNIQVNDDSAGTAVHATKAGGANAIVARGDTLYVVWSDSRECPDGSQIYFAKSINGGESFLPNVKVDDMSPGTSDKMFPCIEVDVIGRIYVAWSDFRNSSGDVYFAKSEDGGVTFSKNICVTDTASGMILGVSIGVAGDNVYIIWADTRHWDGSGAPKCHIYSDRSGDGGLTFGKDIKVDDFPVDAPPYGELFPCIDVLGDTVYAVWSHANISTGEIDIRFDKSIDGGVTFGTDSKVEASGMGQYNPALTVDRNGTIHIVFNNAATVSFQVLYAKSTDGGASFGQFTEVTDTTLPVAGIVIGSGINIATDCCGNPYCIWDDLRDSPEGQYIPHPYFSYSDDGGSSFSKNVRVVDKPGTVGTVNQSGVGLAVDDNKNVYAVWTDTRNNANNGDIYFAKGTQAGIEEKQEAKISAPLFYASPNPFRQTTSIRYQLPSRGHISLKAYDLAGRLIEVLLDGVRDCGTHTLAWAPKVSTGVYFLRLELYPSSRGDEQITNFVVTKRVVILK